MKLSFSSIALATLVFSASSACADSLYGSQVTATVNYPTVGNAVTLPVTKTIGPGIEFPSGTLPGASGINVIGVNIDVGASAIDFTYTEDNTALPGAFNGYVFGFSGATITGAALDPLSTFSSQQVSVDYTSDGVTVNVEGLSFTPSSRILIDVTEASSAAAVPEPQDGTLLLTGLGLIAWPVRRYFRTR